MSHLSGNSPEVARKMNFKNIPANSCAYIAAFDVLKRSKFLEVIHEPKAVLPNLISVLTDRPNSSLTLAIS